MDKRFGMLFASVMVLSLLTLCAAPALMTDSSPEQNSTRAMSPAMPNRDEAVTALLLLGAGAFMVYAYDHWLNNGGSSGTGGATDPDQIMEDYYKAEADKTHIALTRSATTLSNTMGLDSATWYFTNSYWQRCVEQIVSSKWSAAGTYDANAVLMDAAVMSNISALYYNWQALTDAAFYTERGDRVLWNNSSYDIQMAWCWDGTISTGAGSMYPDLCSYATPTAASNLVYIDTALPSDVCAATSFTVYCIGAAGSLTAADGTVYNLEQGRNTINSLPTGIYALGAGSSYAGSLMPVAGGAELAGAMALVDSGDFHIAVAGIDGLSIVSSDGTAVQSASAGYQVTYGKDDVKLITDLTPIITAWDGMISEFESTVSKAATVGSTTWKLFDKLGASSQLVSVSSIIPDLTNVTLTDDQIYALSVLSMVEMSDWYASTSSAMTKDDLAVSGESLELVCHGTIKDSTGNVLASDVIFSPFAYVRDQAITTAGESAWTQPGIAIVWDTGALSAWDGSSDPTAMKLVTLTGGCTLSIDSMTYLGKSVSNMTLQVKSMEKILTDVYETHATPATTPTFIDYTIWVQAFFVLIGAVVAVSGYRSGNVPVILLGLIITVIGLLFAAKIATALASLRW